MLEVDKKCCISVRDNGQEVLHIENNFSMEDVSTEIEDFVRYINAKEVVLDEKDCINTKSLFSIRKNILKGKELKKDDLNSLNKETLVMMVMLLNEDYSLLKDIHYGEKEEELFYDLDKM